MNSHNAKMDTQAKIESVRVETGHDNVRVLKSTPQESAEMSISDDLENGGDPYNSTGQHAILKIKRALLD